ncbi:hypothetical protein R1sor_000503 [Riccia sorocarpa]|uniref:5'-nucleotidase domain-containing protein n=1 Tax=Riccia sorocarpa TaxID=122646 RepID=A0ABD3GXG2_9MARC
MLKERAMTTLKCTARRLWISSSGGDNLKSVSRSLDCRATRVSHERLRQVQVSQDQSPRYRSIAEGSSRYRPLFSTHLDSSQRLCSHRAAVVRDWHPSGTIPIWSPRLFLSGIPEETERRKWKDEGVLEDSGELKAEFEAALRAFSHIPPAIYSLPKMNPNGVYTNYNLRLDQINVYGFDYDYTLAHYTRELQKLIYDLAKEHLVKEYRYPESCLKFKYDPQFPIRGLYYDRQRGNLLKLDFFHSVEPHGCFFGRRRLSRAEIEKQYGGKHISVSDIPNMVALMDLFCLSEACLISDVIQHFVDQNMEFDSAYVYDDVKRSINYVHRSGLMHSAVLADREKYLVKNDAVVEMLKTLKARGKKLFILTNSPFPFVNGGMRFLFQDDGKGGESWRELFDVVLALADKPTFYTSERPFRHYNTVTDMLAFRKLTNFQEGGVYYHGCLKEFLEITQWSGSEVLYCGDHLYTDLRGPAKAGWRTLAVIRELEREIMTQNKPEYRFQQAKYNTIQELMGKYHRLTKACQQGEAEKQLIAALRKERQGARVAMRALFNDYFGSSFVTDTGKESAFAYNVQRYADVYTSRLENIMASDLEAWLYTPYDLKSLPHHIKVSSRVPLQVLLNGIYFGSARSADHSGIN